MDNNITKISVGAYTIELSEEILNRLFMLKQCDYMPQELDEMADGTIEMYNDGVAGCTKAMSAEDAMSRISLLRDAKNDYQFLCSLPITQETGESVFDGEQKDE